MGQERTLLINMQVDWQMVDSCPQRNHFNRVKGQGKDRKEKLSCK